MINELLPLGSVVLLKGGSGYIVIMAYLMQEENKTKIWDYMGCAYPVGITSNKYKLLFDENQIDKVIFRGYSDEEGKKFRNKILDKLKDMKLEK